MGVDLDFTCVSSFFFQTIVYGGGWWGVYAVTHFSCIFSTYLGLLYFFIPSIRLSVFALSMFIQYYTWLGLVGVSSVGFGKGGRGASLVL